MPAIQDYLLERARDDEERAAFPEQLALYPGTAQVVAIGMWMPGEQRGGVLVNKQHRDARVGGLLRWRPCFSRGRSGDPH